MQQVLSKARASDAIHRNAPTSSVLAAGAVCMAIPAFIPFLFSASNACEDNFPSSAQESQTDQCCVGLGDFHAVAEGDVAGSFADLFVPKRTPTGIYLFNRSSCSEEPDQQTEETLHKAGGVGWKDADGRIFQTRAEHSRLSTAPLVYPVNRDGSPVLDKEGFVINPRFNYFWDPDFEPGYQGPNAYTGDAKTEQLEDIGFVSPAMNPLRTSDLSLANNGLPASLTAKTLSSNSLTADNKLEGVCKLESGVFAPDMLKQSAPSVLTFAPSSKQTVNSSVMRPMNPILVFQAREIVGVVGTPEQATQMQLADVSSVLNKAVGALSQSGGSLAGLV